jgi:L-amino acid N-acyltransferase YncA
MMPPTIRLATPDDAEYVQAIYAPYIATPISFELVPPSIEEIRGRMTKVLPQYPWLLCVENDEVVGYAYSSRHSDRAAYLWSVDTSVYVRQGVHRRGIGRGLYTALLAMLPLQGYVNAYAGIAIPNASSVGLHEAMGFQLVGVYNQVGFKCGVWHDVAWFHRPLQQIPDEPRQPRPIDHIRHTGEWEEALNSGIRLLH